MVTSLRLDLYFLFLVDDTEPNEWESLILGG